MKGWGGRRVLRVYAHEGVGEEVWVSVCAKGGACVNKGRRHMSWMCMWCNI